MSANITEIEPPPGLRDGDRLDAGEFHRRYLAMPFVKNAQLIDGVVQMASPVGIENHSLPHGDIMTWLGAYRFGLPGVMLGDNGTFRVDDENEPQPDAMLLLAGESGGNTWIDEHDFLRGSPELIVEIAGSSARLDAGAKRDLYERIGVREYLLWRVPEQRIDWWRLADGRFLPLNPDEQGILRSAVFPGLWLNVPALIAGRMDLVKTTLDAGLAGAEHLAFAHRLRAGTSGRTGRT
jgi:Uma2 family endonuclease